MSKRKTRTQYRRKREAKTNYKKRLKLLQSRKIRLIIRKTNKHIITQLTQYFPDGDKVLVGANSKELEKLGWKYSSKNLPAAYLTGLLLGKKALLKNIKEAILDLGLQTPVKGSKLYAALKGTIDTGLDIHAGEEILPSEERLQGKHIEKYFTEKSNNFTKYKKNKLDLKSITKDIETIKNKIMK